MSITNKRILFFSPKLFGYESAIKSMLESKCAKVEWFDERPSNGFWGKAILRLNRKLIKNSIDAYYKNILISLSSRVFDLIFLLNPEALPLWFLKELKSMLPNADIRIYMWDSFMNRPNAVEYLPYCDYAFSFDPKDIENFPDIIFRPLFYINEYTDTIPNIEPIIDLSFVGTGHSDRFFIVDSIKRQVEKEGYTTQFMLYLQSKKLYWYNKFTNPYFAKANLNNFIFKPLSTSSTIELVKKSKTIIDIQHPKQMGLTMRTLEALGAKRKLITTNESIKQYDFFNENNIMIIDRKNPVIDLEFLSKPYQDIDSKIYYKYSINGWIEDVFSENN